MTDPSELYPYLLQPTLAPAIWGGDTLVRRYGKHGDPEASIGESWECWDTNRILNGPLADSTLAQVRERLGHALLGNLDPTQLFPILTKFIEARDWLSVQVHPNDAYAQRIEHQPNGKTECWYILHAEADAQLVLGWAHATNRREYEQHVADGSLGDILRRVPVKAGDAFYLPAGTLHAIGKGILLFEVQQASDLTYRIFDWNRVGTDGKPRELHVHKAEDVLDYGLGMRNAAESIEYRFNGLARTALIADPRFVLERAIVTRDVAGILTHHRPLILTSLARPIQLHCKGGDATLAPYQTALVPAEADFVQLSAEAQAPLLLVTLPQSDETLPVRLLAAGIAQDRVDRFMAQFA